MKMTVHHSEVSKGKEITRKETENKAENIVLHYKFTVCPNHEEQKHFWLQHLEELMQQN